jgi:hypothetical protein
MTNLRIRKQSTPSHYPENVVRIMRPQIFNTMQAVKAHFSRRHNGPEYRQAVRNWAQGVKEIDAGSGYSTALAQTLGKLETPVCTPA